MNYRPLPDFLTIRDSEINGLGLFATEYIEKDKILGKCHFIHSGRLERTPLGAFYNHSDNPNCIKVTDSTRVYYLKTLQEIKPLEEITVNYTFYELL